MHHINGTMIFSPSDLTLYMQSPFASWMEHYFLINPDSDPKPDQPDLMLSLLQEKGNAHELSILSRFKANGLSIKDLSNTNNSIENTLNAMKDGIDIIYQAFLEKSPFAGRSDFLVRVPGKSALSDYHYEVWDTKLSRKVKPNYVIQLCSYTDMLGDIQGFRPENFVIVLGSEEELRLKVDNYFYYYEQLKRSFLDFHLNINLENTPDPADSRSWGRWIEYAESLLINRDHLSQVANITNSQIKKINKAGIITVKDLIDSKSDRVSGIDSDVVTRLKAQAKIQKESQGRDKPLFHIYIPEFNQKRGLALLPPHSPLDIFFDVEGYPLEEEGLEYLWGMVFFDENGKHQFKDFWAHNKIDEKQAFKEFIEWAYSRWQQDPTMHIYHYANYEIAVCRKLMSQYGLCEYEVDQLLRNEVFVDLYKIVKGGVLLGEPKYSIKNVERLYRKARQTEVGKGDESIVVYDNWRENPDGYTWQTSKMLNYIREYNMDDCYSTQELVDWLRERQKENNISFIGKTGILEPEVKEHITERIQLRETLLERAKQLTSGNESDAAIAENLAWSLEFHRREHKPVFWRLFDRLGMEDYELLDDIDCLANCIRTDREPFKPTPKSRNLAYEYKFNPDQEFKGICENYCIIGEENEDGKNSKVTLLKEYSNTEAGIIVLQAKNEPPSVISLVPDEYINPEPIPTAIYSQAKAFYENKLRSYAILDFLRSDIPKIRGHNSQEPIAPSVDAEEKLREIIHAIKNLNNSYLVIQGPPGAGKTYTAKHVIAELLKMGKRIGICSNSHKAINHLLISAAEYCKEKKINASFVCTKNTEPLLETLGVKIIENNKLSLEINNNCVIGTTAWGFSRDDLEDAFDYLFIDEAGQVSVANLIAISQSTKNIVLMGDQMQLGQPSQGTHPADSGLSILDYLLHETPTIPERLGVFLGTTFRMHSAVNQYISDAIYEGKLKADIDNDRQKISVPESYQGILNKPAGIIFVPVEHEGNTQSSDEEVLEIKKLANEMLGRIFTDKKLRQRPITWDDMIFLAPYNHQVNKLRKALGEKAKIGSVDKFQGQEAPIVFLSMCASNAVESPRGAGFLFNRHRLNVAISRAQCLVIILANPGLTQMQINSIEQMELLNTFCHLIQTANL